jgi:hypothetical protein
MVMGKVLGGQNKGEVIQRGKFWEDTIKGNIWEGNDKGESLGRT